MALELQNCRRYRSVLHIMFSDEDKILFNNLHHLNGYKAMELTNKFSNKNGHKKH